jgi:hypothetical protein
MLMTGFPRAEVRGWPRKNQENSRKAVPCLPLSSGLAGMPNAP